MDIGLFLTFFAFCFGLVVGSFFNVLIWRLPRNESIASPGSHCPACNRPIRWFENMPLLSFILLRARCPGCKAPISWRYPAVELLTALLMTGIWLFFRDGIHSWNEWAIFVLRASSLLVLIPLSAIDIKHYILPDAITLSGIAAAVLAAFIPRDIPLLMALRDCGLGLLTGGGMLLLVGLIGSWIFKKEAMGMGDVKLMAFLGAFWGWEIALMGIIFASFVGAAAGGVMLLFRKLGPDHRIPFGPFLAAGTVAAVFAGKTIAAAYFGLMERIIGF